jgi:hypothetical protein
MSERAKIRARRVTGNDAQQQRAVARAIRVAREMALLPYSVRQVTHRSKGGKGRDREGRERDLPMPRSAPDDDDRDAPMPISDVDPASEELADVGERDTDTGGDAEAGGDTELEEVES